MEPPEYAVRQELQAYQAPLVCRVPPECGGQRGHRAWPDLPEQRACKVPQACREQRECGGQRGWSALRACKVPQACKEQRECGGQWGHRAWSDLPELRVRKAPQAPPECGERQGHKGQARRELRESLAPLVCKARRVCKVLPVSQVWQVWWD